ncbi:MAG: hypothetical protein EA422_15970 [Gemmatimonadales bacterium]|nr:MAG: hypothetical protein EA422_15970 [Gemmatimonadales bacterium]
MSEGPTVPTPGPWRPVGPLTHSTRTVAKGLSRPVETLGEARDRSPQGATPAGRPPLSEGPAVRIPTINLQRTSLEGIQSNLRAMDSAIRQLTSGNRVEVPSDDPAASRSIIRTNSVLEENQQYSRNISRARSLNTLQESVLDQVDELLVRGRELAIGQAGSTATEQTRLAAASEVRGLMESMTDLANTRLGSRYIFAGLDSGTPPLPSDGPLPTGSTPIEIGPGRTVAPTESASRIFGDTGALAALEELAEALETNNPTAIQQASYDLRESQTELQVLVAETGNITNRLEAAGSRLEILEANLVEYRSDLRDVNFEEVVSELAARETAYQAALLATSRILSQNLTDFLR